MEDGTSIPVKRWQTVVYPDDKSIDVVKQLRKMETRIKNIEMDIERRYAHQFVEVDNIYKATVTLQKEVQELTERVSKDLEQLKEFKKAVRERFVFLAEEKIV